MSSEEEHKRQASGHHPDTIAGYRILGQLGRGGTGVVWEAEQEHPRRRVALKVLRRDHLVDEYHTRMFQREAETLARLKHPNIAAIYESGHTDDGHDYFAMELVQGETLDRWLEGRPETIDADELELRLHLFRIICNAVHYAHQRGVIHRDLKPANIIVTPEADLVDRPHFSRRSANPQDPRLRACPHHRLRHRGHRGIGDRHHQGHSAVHEPGAGPRRHGGHRYPH